MPRDFVQWNIFTLKNQFLFYALYIFNLLSLEFFLPCQPCSYSHPVNLWFFLLYPYISLYLGEMWFLLLLSPRTVSSDSLKCLIKYFPSKSESTLRLLPFFLFPIFVPTTLELQVPTTISNLEYFAVPPTRELKMPLITLFPKSLFSFAI